MDKFIEDFQGGKLQIDFISLALVQNTIKQTGNDTLALRLYSVETKNSDFVTELKRIGRAIGRKSAPPKRP